MIYCILFLNVGGVFIEYCNGLRFDIVIMDKKIKKKKLILNFLKNREKEVFDGIVLFIVVILSLFGFVSIINF